MVFSTDASYLNVVSLADGTVLAAFVTLHDLFESELWSNYDRLIVTRVLVKGLAS